MKKIAVIGANEPLEHFYKQAKDLGYYIVGIAWAEGVSCLKYCDVFYPVSFSEKDKVLEICIKEKIDGIISFSLESALPTLIYVAQKMGLVSNSTENLERLSNKFTMREWLNKAGISNPKYVTTSNVEDLNNITIPFPCIVKPIDSGGSQGVTMVYNKVELDTAFTRAFGFSKSGNVIIEEYIDGREFSVEYLSYQGKHYNIQITDKVTSGGPYFVELQHHQPADISEELHDRICNLVEHALTALCVENSASHTELKLNSRNELYIIEIGARLGGDYITSDLVRLSTDYDMVKGALEIATGTFVPPVISNKHFSGVYFYSSITPEIKKYIDNAQEYPFIIEAFRHEKEIQECKRNGDRNGHILYQADKKIILQ